MEKRLEDYLNRPPATLVVTGREMGTALKCATWLAILFGGEPDLIGALIAWIS